jgi:hypothetical protein
MASASGCFTAIAVILSNPLMEVEAAEDKWWSTQNQ